MKASEDLEKARQKIINIDDWFPGYDRSSIEMLDRFSNRKTNKASACHCAITAVGDSEQYTFLYKILKQAIKAIDPSATDPILVTEWNDKTTHDMVVKAYDAAIELAKELEV